MSLSIHSQALTMLLAATVLALTSTAFAQPRDEVPALLARLETLRSSPTDPFPMPRATVAHLAEIEAELTPSRVTIAPVVEARESGWVCDSETIRIPYKVSADAPVETFTAILRMPHRTFGRLPWSPKTDPVIIIQPTLAGPSFLENDGIATPLCNHGFASIVPTETVLGLPANLPNLQAYDQNLRIEMIRARRMVDVVSTDPRLNAGQIGTIGFSRGGIAGALLIGIESRITFAFLGAGGVGVARIIARSQTEKGIADNAAQMKGFADKGDPVSPAEYERRLLETIRYDGILFVPRLNPARVKLMIVENDESVPTASQKLLRDQLCLNTLTCPEVVVGEPNLIPLARRYPSVSGHPALALGAVSDGKLGVHVESILNLVFQKSYEFLDFFAAQIR